MLHSFNEIRELLGQSPARTVAIACAHDLPTLEAAVQAEKDGLLRCILIGNGEKIRAICATLDFVPQPEAILETATDEEAAAAAVRLVREGRADFIQKGHMQTATILKAVVNKETGIARGSVMSHIALFEFPGYHKLLCLTDSGMIPHPDLETKKAIVTNVINTFHRLGYDEPLVGAICGAETVSPKIPETVDALALKEAAQTGAFGRCILEGPISFDLAVDPRSAAVKHYDSPVAGNADILVVPNLAAGNFTGKALLTFANAKMVGLVVGAACPIALNSRSASFGEKYSSLLTCALMCQEGS